MSKVKENSVRTIQRFEPRPDVVYPLETAAHIAQVTRHAILVYCNHGLISPARDPREAGYYFNDEAIRAIRHIAFLRNHCDIDLRGTRIIMNLIDEVERLQNELRFRRG